jgi:hypothetical protein
MAIIDTTREGIEGQLLRLVADCPERLGALDAARIVSGHRVPDNALDALAADGLDANDYVAQNDCGTYTIVHIVSDLIRGGLINQTGGDPTLFLSRRGLDRIGRE